ncbi:MAG: hypothetical protein EPN30_00875 [Actinomycetota bacterium]|nr:MAG: hypothetical protein EPN30_00875 [Actinomycetota bacterium]
MKAVIRNEFAMVEVFVDEYSSMPTLIVRDLRSGRRVELDALELEAFTHAEHRQLSSFADPSQLA